MNILSLGRSLASFIVAYGGIDLVAVHAFAPLRSLSADGLPRRRLTSRWSAGVDLKQNEDLQNYFQAAEERSLAQFARDDAPAWLQTIASLPFECTACGKCCKTIGSVYLSSEETRQAAKLMNISSTEFIEAYASDIIRDSADASNTWVRLKEKEVLKGTDHSPACIFLNSDTNQCQIYEARPTQCRTYPFWPNLLASPDAWDAEVRRMDHDSESTLLEWTPDAGGCEGMMILDQNSTTLGVPMKDVYRQLREYRQQDRYFPTGDKKADTER